MAVQTLQFYTLGPDFTILVENLVKEGAFYNAYQILKDGGLKDEHIRLFFCGGVEFKGDSRGEDGLSVHFKKVLPEEELVERFTTAIRTCIAHTGLYIQDVLLTKDLEELHSDDITKHLDCLFKVIPKAWLVSMLTPSMLLDAGFDIVEACYPNFNGVILEDGRIVECGYQEHSSLFPTLYALNLSDDSRWTDSKNTIHISSGQASGSLIHDIKNWSMYKSEKGAKVDPRTLRTLAANYKNISIYGSSHRTIMNILMGFYEEEADHGGKFGKLNFLKECYPNINLPKFSKTEIEGVKNCIRTSPKFSMAGLLTSKFDINENSIKEIEADWDKYKHVTGNSKKLDGTVVNENRLNYFYQEYLEGINGVAHCRAKNITYECSSERGAIVEGKKGNIKLEADVAEKLRVILEDLSKALDKDIQVEFVVSPEDKLYIVQLRTLEDVREYRSYQIDHKKVVASGKSFTMGYADNLKLEDVLIVDRDCESHEVIGKKAIIVREDAEFSHALALSFSLKIPSIYGVGNDFKLPEEFKLDTAGRDGYILTKIK